MNPANAEADIYVPDGIEIDQALDRTTHLGIGAHADAVALDKRR